MNNDLISLHSLLGGSKSPDLKNKELTLLTGYFFNTKTNDLYIKHMPDDDEYQNMTEDVKDSKGNYLQPIFVHDCHNGKKLILSVQLVDAKKSKHSKNKIFDKIKYLFTKDKKNARK